MTDYKLAEAESRFADLIWENAPLTSPKLTALAAEVMNWKKTTTYTVLKKLCNKGLFKNEYMLVTALISRDEFYAKQSVKYVDDTYGGSLPRFMAAFTSARSPGGRRGLTDAEADEIQRLIDDYRNGGERDE